MFRCRNSLPRRPCHHRFALEARQLFDGAAVAEATQHADNPQDAVHHENTVQPTKTVSVAQTSADAPPAHQVYVVDSRVQNWQSLVSQLPPSSRVIVLNDQQSGLEQINNALKNDSNITALHIISHGASDSLTLGSDKLTDKTIANYQQQLERLGEKLTQNGDILLYGCDITFHDTVLITRMADYSHADIAASSDATGSTALGGDWTLESHAGIIETHGLTLAYDGLLEAPVIATSAQDIVVSEPTSLHPGTETAQFSGWTITATDPEVAVSVTLSNPAAGNLISSTASGSTLSFTGTALDAQAWVNTLKFTASDIELGNQSVSTGVDFTVTSESGTDTATTHITVTPANDPVVVNDSTLSVPETVGANTTITEATLAALDPELQAGAQSASQIVYSLTVMPQYGYLTLNGTRIGVGSVFSQQDVRNGALVYIHTATGNSQNTNDSFSVLVNDGATPIASSDSATVTLQITSENQPPVLTGSGGRVYEGQPQNAVTTGNVGLYITADGGGDPQDTQLTLMITTLPAHGTLFFNGIPVILGQQIAYADRNLLTYANDGEDGITQDTFGVRISDQGGGTGTPASTDGVITLNILPVDDDPVLNIDSTLHADVVAGPADVTLTPDMLTSVDVDSPAERVSFIVDTAGLTHGYLTLNGLLLKSGDTFTMEELIEGRVIYVQYVNADFIGQQDTFNFRVIDHSTALRWNPDGSTFSREGGIWDSESASSSLTSFPFTITLIRFTNGQNPSPDQVPPWNVPATTESSDYIGTDVTNPANPPHGVLVEGGSITISGTGNITDATPGMSYVVQGIDPSQVVYTFLGTGSGSGQSGLTLLKSDGQGGSSVIVPFGTFTQADLNAGLIRIVHDGGETFFFDGLFSVSAGQVTLDAQGNPVAVTWNPEMKVFVTPINDIPQIIGSSTTVLAEGETVYITTAQLQIGDADDANSGSPWESGVLLNGSNNYAFNNDATGANALKFVIQSLPTGGVLQYFNGTTWVTITSADIGTLRLDASLLKSDNSSGLRFVSNSSEIRSTSFIVSAIDRWGAPSATNATVGIIITNVNDGPTLPATPDSPDIVVPPEAPNQVGGPPVNDPVTVVEGGFQKITSLSLQAYDPDSTAEQVHYILTAAPAHGLLARSTDGVTFSTIGNGSNFTQDDLNKGYIYYLHNGDDVTGNGLNADGFTFTISDGDKEQTNNHFAINITPADDAPVVNAPAGPINVGGTVHSVGGFTVSDPDLSGSATNVTNILQTTIRLLHSDGSVFSQGDYSGIIISVTGVSGLVVSGGNQAYLVLTGTVAQINSALSGLTVTFPNDRNLTYQVQVMSDDRLRNGTGQLTGEANGGPVNQPVPPTFSTPPGPVDAVTYNWYQDAVPNNGNVVANQVVINASETNDPGHLAIGSTDKTTFEDQPTFIGGDITVSDIESNAFNLPVTLTLTVAQGQLGIGGAGTQTELNGVTISGDNSGTLVLTGTANAIQTLLNDASLGLTYLSTANANQDQNGVAAGDVTLTMHLDTTGSTIGTALGTPPADVIVALTIIPVNDKPTVTAPTNTILLDNNAPNGNQVPGFVIGDPDISDSGGIAAGETDIVQVTIRITHEDGTPFAVGQYRDQQNSAINITSGNTTSGVTIQSTSPDGVNPPSNGEDAPLVITGTVAQINAYLAQLQVRMSGIQLDDADQYFHVEVIVDDRLRDASGNLLQGANGGDNPAASGSGTTPPAQTAIDPYALIPTGLEQNVTVNYRTVFQSSINDPAQIKLGATPVLNANEGSATVTLPAIVLSDVDAGSQVLSATVTLPAGFVFVAPGGSGGTVTGVGSGTLTLTGSLAEINSRLAALVVTLPDTPGSATAADWNGNFGVVVTVNDAGHSGSRPVTLPNLTDPTQDPGAVSYADGTSAQIITTRTFTFTVNPVNDVPPVAGTPTQTLASVTEDSLSTSVTGNTVANLFGSFFDDSHDTVNNSGNGGNGGTSTDTFYGIAINQLTVNPAQGEWQYTFDGTTWLAVGNRSDSNALVLTAGSALRFVPAANYFGTPATLGVRLVETNTNNDSSTSPVVPPNGSVVDISAANAKGGSAVFSAEIITLSTSVSNVNDRPTLSDIAVSVAEDSRTTATIAEIFQPLYSDAIDNQTAIAGGGNASGPLSYIAVFGDTTDLTKGHWEYSTDGVNWTVLPTDLSASHALVLSSATFGRFVPLADYNGPIPGGLQIRATDTSDPALNGVSGSFVDLTVHALDSDPTSHWSNAITLTIVVTPVVDIANDTFSTHADVPLVINATDLLANDSFTNADKTVTVVTQPSHGTLDYTNGVLTYTPEQGYVGQDSYTYTVVSGGVSETATVAINVTNQPPVAVNDNRTLNEDTSATGNILTSDSDADTDAITLTTFTVEGQTYAAGTLVTLAASHGTLQINADGSYVYTPGGDWHGDIAVSYNITDGNQGGTASATFGLHINAIADAKNNIAIAHANTVITTDVLANDTFVNPDRAITSFTQPLHGTVTQGPGTSLIYTPDSGFVGSDSYTYTVASGGVTETATVFIVLTNNSPTATNQIAATDEDTPITGNVLRGIIDPDGDPLHVADYQIAGVTGTFLAGETAVIPGVGTFIVLADGSATFTPIADWNGVVPTITFNVADNTSDPPIACTLDITVRAVADIVSDVASTHAGQAVTIDALANDHFSNSDATITAVGTPLHGSVSIVNNQLVYTPTQGYVGDDTFSYSVTSGGIVETASVTVTMTNTVPEVSPTLISTPEDTPIVNGNLLADASDADSDTLTVTDFTVEGVTYAAGQTVTIAGQGTLTVTSAGLYTFTPVADWFGLVHPITFTTSDGNDGGEVNSILLILVLPVTDIQPDNATTHADNAVVINVLGNDTFSNASPVVTVAPDSSTVGSITVLADNTVRYTPPLGFVGTDTFTYTVVSGGISETSTVTVVVTNTPPQTTDTPASINEDGGALSGGLNVSDPDSDVLRVLSFQVAGMDGTFAVENRGSTTITIPGVGDLTMSYDHQYSFTPVADWNGTVPTITYIVTDDNGDAQASGTLNIVVVPVVDIADDSITLQAGTASANNVLANDTFENSDRMVTAVTQGLHGTVTIGSNGVVTYTPAPDYVGTDLYTYTVTSGGVTETATVSVTVTNTVPVAQPDSQTADEDITISGNVLSNDSDSDTTDTLSVISFTVSGDAVTHLAGETVTLAGFGALTLRADGSYSFVPVADWNGAVPVISYTLSDGHTGGTASSTLTLNVTPVVDIQPDVGATHAGVAETIDVLANDSFENAGRVITATTNGEHGSVTIVDGKIVYTPQPGYVGLDNFTYTVTSGGVTETSNVTVNVTNTAPQAVADISTSPEDTLVTGNVLQNDRDQNGDPIFVNGFATTDDSSAHAPGTSLTFAGMGVFTLNRDGSWSFQPVADWNGTLPTILYTITDGNIGGNSGASLDITISPVQDAINDNVTTHGNVAVTTDVLANDTFSNPDKTIESVTQGAHGSVAIVNGQILYTPNTGYVGPDSYTYTVLSGGILETATVTVAVQDERPVTRPDLNFTPEDNVVTGNVLANDNDPDGDPLVVTHYLVAGQIVLAGDSVTLAGVGELVLRADGSYTLTPVADWNGTAPVVIYTVSDTLFGGISSGLLVINMTAVQDAIADSTTTHAGQPVTTDVLTNDTFSNPDATITAVTNGANGTAVLVDGQIVYTPRSGFVGNDTYTYTVTSGGVSETTTVNVQVTNSAPVVEDEKVITPQGTEISGNLLVNDSDPDGDPIHLSLYQVDGAKYLAGETATLAGVGRLTIQADGSYLFVPESSYRGFVPLVIYTVSDGNEGGETSSTLRILVAPSLEIVVDEAGLTPLAPGTDEVSGRLNILALNPIRSVTLLGQTIPVEQLTRISPLAPIVIETINGTMTLQAFYSFAEGEAYIDYQFVLRGAVSQPGQSATFNDYDIDVNGITIGNLRITVVNDHPISTDNSAEIVQDSGQTSASGNVLNDDRIGADRAPANGAVMGVVSQNTGAVGTVGGTSSGQYGSLFLDAFGNWQYQINAGDPRLAALDASAFLTDVFVYTIVDSDGGISQARLTIVIYGVTAVQNVTSGGEDFFYQNGSALFNHGGADFASVAQKSYQPGLFILPLIYDLQSDSLSPERLWDKQLATYGYGVMQADTPILESILLTRWYYDSREQRGVPSLEGNGLGRNLLWDAFSPFGIRQASLREPFEIPVPQGEQQAVTHGSVTLTAQLAALGRQTAVSTKQIAIPTITRQ
ncbi:Ig-like domain-containing protein [Buttiauxella selenatireducens]|uniref:Ig-like domain-containing protein n=1 Tax=Buttiauxella selenatireducens TaxID=3073902 RepID=A0ABY9S825_9ENTR|nr:Ig-like domain-containing protein [Buttiauxella sp. R73]WMY72591.1 Ig-like domain-containing protein [Buttiauxella sp. R73]